MLSDVTAIHNGVNSTMNRSMVPDMLQVTSNTYVTN